eukprot:2292151-Karenia_brevis.AAC.1
MRCNRVLEGSAQPSHLSMREGWTVAGGGAVAQRGATAQMFSFNSAISVCEKTQGQHVAQLLNDM